MEKLSGWQDVLRTLSDGQWHTVYELNEKHGWKVTSRISDLINKKGCVIDKEKVEEGKPELKYKLLQAPKELSYVIDISKLDKFARLTSNQFSLF